MTEVVTIKEVIQLVKVADKKVSIVTVGTQGPPGTGGDLDHGALNGLEDDDHLQYHNDARGDARYYTKAQVDAGLAGKANSSHGHAISDVSGLQTALDSKAASSHGHSIANVSGLQTALDNKLDASFAALIPKTGQVTVDFGSASGEESPLASVSVSAPWVTDASVILCNAAGVATPDHDPEDAALDGVTAVAANLNEGVGFDVIARAPQGSWGRFNINIIGV
ncbi:MAG: hypothetical protein EAY76_00125 [Alphaproteobacteria bacterium]|nr:MAG: hypothetical protein EAY76_00125 [Alphaproteobacteria bacterium]